MVSGFVTSPCDQLRIFSGEARLIRMLSKSEMLFPRSNGLERYKVSSVAHVAQAPSPVSDGLPAACYESVVKISHSGCGCRAQPRAVVPRRSYEFLNRPLLPAASFRRRP